METITVNELVIPCPEGFHVLDEKERSRLNFTEGGAGECMSDPQRHIFVSAGWKKIGLFSSLLLKDQDIINSMKASIGKSMSQFGFQEGGSIKRTVGGREAEGFCYTYTTQGVAMYGETLVMKAGKTLYNFHFYAREQLKAESIPVWENLLKGVR